MQHTFKLKMALFSAFTSGAILLAFALLFLSMIRRVGLERLDRQLHAVAQAQTRRPEPPEHWARFDASLAALYGEGRPRQFLVKAIGRDGHPVYASPRWPEALSDDALKVPEFLSQKSMPDLRAPPPERPLFRHGRPEDVPRFRLGRPPGEEPPPRSMPKRPRFITAQIEGHPWRLVMTGTDAMTLIVGTDLADFQAELQRHWNTFAVAGPIGLLLLATAGWLLAGQALRPVKVLTRVAGGITAKGLDQRVRVAGADQEFRALIDVLNGMLDRLEISFRQAARFSADAAHELKTPLTILQGQLHQALQGAPADSDEQRTYVGLLDEVQRLKGIVRKLLLLAQSDSGRLRLARERVDLTAEIEALCEDAPLLAPGLSLQKDLAPQVCVMADPDLLRQVAQNLFSNAVKYNREGGSLACRLWQEGANVIFTLANTTDSDGGLERERLFDRFYRGDPSRNRAVDGTGLGLSLAREISRAHGGDLVLDESETREGWIAFRLTLPATVG
jgi:signal transduction histidine kinase